jgi:hypothetical protein
MRFRQNQPSGLMVEIHLPLAAQAPDGAGTLAPPAPGGPARAA